MSSNDDIIRDSLFNTGVEVVDTAGNPIRGKQSARAPGKPVPDCQFGQDNHGVHVAIVPGGHHNTGGVAVQEGVG